LRLPDIGVATAPPPAARSDVVLIVITQLNLASKPFRNRNLPYILALLLLAISVAGAVLCFARLRHNSELNEIAKAQIAQMDTDVKRLNGEGEKVQQQLTPDQRRLLVEAHKLVANKSFGWSRLFADLESVLPGNVSASRISVTNVYRDGDRNRAELEFGVLSRDYSAVAGMIQNMNNSGLFQAELRGQDLQKNEHSSYSEYTLRLVYTPAYGYAPASSASDVASTGGTR
jgi:Tfp pilus assembly protein PilN